MHAFRRQSWGAIVTPPLLVYITRVRPIPFVGEVFYESSQIAGDGPRRPSDHCWCTFGGIQRTLYRSSSWARRRDSRQVQAGHSKRAGMAGETAEQGRQLVSSRQRERCVL